MASFHRQSGLTHAAKFATPNMFTYEVIFIYFNFFAAVFSNFITHAVAVRQKESVSLAWPGLFHRE